MRQPTLDTPCRSVPGAHNRNYALERFKQAVPAEDALYGGLVRGGINLNDKPTVLVAVPGTVELATSCAKIKRNLCLWHLSPQNCRQPAAGLAVQPRAPSV
jgi:hypothetical protein